MKKKIFLFGFLFGVLFLVSCEQNYIDRKEDQIIGSWNFDRVTYQRAFNNDNLTNDYDRSLLTFYDDFTVEYELDNGDVLFGTWAFNLVQGGETIVDQLVMSFIDNNGGQEFYIWDNLTVNNRTMRAIEDYENGDYNYRLRKL